MVFDNYHHHHSWQSPVSEQVGTISQQALAMVRRITEPLYPTLRWLRLASLFDIEPQTFARHLNWLDSLVERLQSTSNWSTLLRRQETLPFLQSPYFVWFDPRYWINRMGRENSLEYYDRDDEAVPGFMPANSPITIPTLKQPFPAKQSGLPRSRQFGTSKNLAVFPNRGRNMLAADSPLEQQSLYTEDEHETYPRHTVSDSVLSRTIAANTPVMAVPEPNEFISTKRQINKIASTTPPLETMSHANEYHQSIDRTLPSQSVDTTPLTETAPIEKHASKFTRVISKAWDKISSPLTTQFRQAIRFIRAENAKDVSKSSLPADTVRRINLNITPPAEIQPEPSHELTIEPVERTLPEQPPALAFPMHMAEVRLSDTASAELTMPDEAVTYSNEQTGEKIPAISIWNHYPTTHRIPADAIGVSAQETDSGIGGPARNGDFNGQRAGVLTLALAPTARSPRASGSAASSTTSSDQRPATERADEETPAYDPELVAAEVYAILRRRLVIERERAQGIL